MSKVYMHTIDGKPAKYVEGEQIVFLNNASKNVLRDSLNQIRADQKATIKWRKRNGFKCNDARYGYVMFYLPEQP